MTAIAPAGAVRPTQTQIARAAMTPRSSKLLPDALLDTRLGRGTIAGALNDQIRFRVVGEGPISSRAIVPDSKLAVELLASPAGPRILRQLREAASSADPLSDRTDLDGFMLNRDTESLLAGQILANLDRGYPDAQRLVKRAEQGKHDLVRKDLTELRQDYAPSIARAGAWNSDGWIQFLPDVSRAILVSAGAYRPRANEPVRRALYADYITGNLKHEVQHSITFPSETAYVGAAKWLEEGTANVLSRTPTIMDRTRRATGVNRHSYAAHVGHAPNFSTDWQPWKRPKVASGEKDKTDKEQQRNYQDSQPVLRELVKLGGGSFDSNAGIERVLHILQDKSLRFVPGLIADAIIREHDLDPSVRERLRTRIAHAVDEPGAVRKLRSEFGID